jgi:type I restriction enzyme S subunit
MNNKATGANLPRASANAIESFRIFQPPIKLQNQFAAIVEKVELIKKQYYMSLIELENMYSVLSQNAFKGDLKSKKNLTEYEN